MRIVRTVAELRAALARARAAPRSGSSRRWARCTRATWRSSAPPARCADVVVVSLFVNPTQFGPAGDLAAYPRDEERDAALAEAEGADLLFAPPSPRSTPRASRRRSTSAASPRRSRARRAARPLRRRGHRRHQALQHGRPRRRLLRPEGRPAGARHPPPRARPRHARCGSRSCPTVREPDGLALSSRNVHLRGDDRERALALVARAARRSSARSPPASSTPRRRAPRRARDGRPAASSPEYLALVTPTTSRPRSAGGRRRPRRRRGSRRPQTRLIDNTLITANGGP